MTVCSACGLDFTGTRDFDAHRIGKHLQTGPSDYRDRRLAGLVPMDEDWHPKHGRRCLDIEELADAGWFLDRYGRWSHPSRLAQKLRGVPQDCLEAITPAGRPS